MHRDLVARLEEAGAGSEEAFCAECAAPLESLLDGGLCRMCIEIDPDDCSEDCQTDHAGER